MTRYAIISGSHRPQSQSIKVAQFIQRTIQTSHASASASIIDLGGNPLPFWDESAWSGDPKWDKTWKPISETLKSADAVIVISPEWSGMVPPGLKNLFLLCSNQELAHKPGLIVTVSAGPGGTYPVAELRTSSYKNTRFCYIPDHVIIRYVGNVLNDFDKSASTDDTYLRDRLKYSLRVLEQYAAGLKNVRDSGAIDLEKYPNGM